MPKQSVNQVTVKTGGKLYIAGEYSVLTAGQTALIQFIPIFMSAGIDPQGLGSSPSERLIQRHSL